MIRKVIILKAGEKLIWFVPDPKPYTFYLYLFYLSSIFGLFTFRQTTPFDTVCYHVVKKEHGYHGARVFYDIDFLMKEIMQHLLTEEQLAEWEAGRESRQREYDQQRQAPQS